MRESDRSASLRSSPASMARAAPRSTAIAVAVVWVAATTIGITIMRSVAPGLASRAQALVVLIALSLLVAAPGSA